MTRGSRVTRGLSASSRTCPLISVWWLVGFGLAFIVLIVLSVIVRPKWWLFLFIPLTLACLIVGPSSR